MTITTLAAVTVLVVFVLVLLLAVRWVRRMASIARHNEAGLQELARAKYAADVELSKAQRRIANLQRVDRSPLYREAIEDVQARAARLKHDMAAIEDLSRHATPRDVAARVRAINEIAGNAKESGRR